MRRAGPEEDAADGEAAPDHAEVVGVALAGDGGRAKGERFGRVGHGLAQKSPNLGISRVGGEPRRGLRCRKSIKSRQSSLTRSIVVDTELDVPT